MSGSLRLFHVSDLHFGYEDRDALDWFIEEVRRDSPDAILCTGDLTMRGTAREFALARAWLSALPVPLYLMPGNHDVPYYWYPLARALHPWRHYRALEAGLCAGSALPDVCVVPLNTVAAGQWRLNWSKGRVSHAGLDEALRGLAHHHEKGLRLVTCHHPLLEDDPHRRPSTHGGRQALAALARAGAHAVLSGHVHDAFDRTVEIDGQEIRLIGAGTLSRRLRASPPGYNRLEWMATGGLQVLPQVFA